MAALDKIYNDVARMVKVAVEVEEANLESVTPLGEQADRLEIIAELAARNAKLLRAMDKVLGG